MISTEYYIQGHYIQYFQIILIKQIILSELIHLDSISQAPPTVCGGCVCSCQCVLPQVILGVSMCFQQQVLDLFRWV